MCVCVLGGGGGGEGELEEIACDLVERVLAKVVREESERRETGEASTENTEGEKVRVESEWQSFYSFQVSLLKNTPLYSVRPPVVTMSTVVPAGIFFGPARTRYIR